MIKIETSKNSASAIKDALDGIRFTARATAKNDCRRWAMYMYYDGTRFQATDNNKRAHQYTPTEDERDFLYALARRDADELKLGYYELIKNTKTAVWLNYVGGDILIGTYPNLDRCFPDGATEKFTVDSRKTQNAPEHYTVWRIARLWGKSNKAIFFNVEHLRDVTDTGAVWAVSFNAENPAGPVVFTNRSKRAVIMPLLA